MDGMNGLTYLIIIIIIIIIITYSLITIDTLIDSLIDMQEKISKILEPNISKLPTDAKKILRVITLQVTPLLYLLYYVPSSSPLQLVLTKSVQCNA